jgi:6-hydroxy-3-succinoylpyridine 3-monooxygenase
MEQGTVTLRTRVYIDGYNLYYGCLKRTPYKWLDLRALFGSILPSIHYERAGAPARFALEPLAIKYFTAPILKNFASSSDSVSSQARYYGALQGHLGEAIHIVEGYYDARPARAYLCEKGKTARECGIVEIWKLEEKLSDMALALHAYRDVLRGELDHVVFVTNDTDFVPALQMIREDTTATVGLIVPTRDDAGNANIALSELAHWTRTHIVEAEFAQSQMPVTVRCNDRIIHKPLSWYPRPDLLVPIYEEVKRVKGSHGAALKWLNQPCAHLGGRIPIKMAEDETAAIELRAYMVKYARDFEV